MKNRKKVARRNRYFTTNFGNSGLAFSAWKIREKASAKEALSNLTGD